VTVGEWLADRGSGAPAPLLDGVREALGPEGSRPASAVSEVLLDVAERELAAWLAEESGGRAGAVPLLTIDALVTLALEAAADRPDEIDAIAEDAIRRLSALAALMPQDHSDSRSTIPDSPGA
jgi:hypothetical protein